VRPSTVSEERRHPPDAMVASCAYLSAPTSDATREASGTMFRLPKTSTRLWPRGMLLTRVTRWRTSACFLAVRARVGPRAAARGSQTSREGAAVGVDAAAEGGVVHQAADDVVGEQQAVCLLQHALRALRAQHRARSALGRQRPGPVKFFVYGS
jgi:hypothetical protein